MMEGPGRVFFVKPPNPIASFIWDLYLNQSMFVGQYLLVGTNDDAIEHTWFDSLLTKDFWRGALDGVGARLPRQLGEWNDTEYTSYHPLGDSDVVVKLPDSYLGIGDSFWNKGKDYNTEEELVALLAKEYAGKKDVLVLELVRPKKSEGVHSIDIITMRTPNDEVRVLSCLFWTDCTTDSSHSTQAGLTPNRNP